MRGGIAFLGNCGNRKIFILSFFWGIVVRGERGVVDVYYQHDTFFDTLVPLHLLVFPFPFHPILNPRSPQKENPNPSTAPPKSSPTPAPDPQQLSQPDPQSPPNPKPQNSPKQLA